MNKDPVDEISMEALYHWFFIDRDAAFNSWKQQISKAFSLFRRDILDQLFDIVESPELQFAGVQLANIMSSRGKLYFLLNDKEKSQQQYEAALKLYRAADDQSGIIDCAQSLQILSSLTLLKPKAAFERLPFQFYRTLYDEVISYAAHFRQLQRDYERQLRGEAVVFAVDFSELRDYLHAAARDAHRAQVNTYILNTLNDQFTLLPGAIGELLNDLEKVIPPSLRPDLGKALYTHPTVVEFRSAFPAVMNDDAQLIQLYSKAEADLRAALGGILDVFLTSARRLPIQALHDLLETGKLAPIQGVQQIGSLSPQTKDLMRLVESFLNVDRSGMTENNQVDAMDFSIALALNQQADPAQKRYVTIYSQTVSLIKACRSHDSLRWNDDYLIREARYLRYRTKLQDMFATVKERRDYVHKGYELCQQLADSIITVIDVDEKFREGEVEPPLRLLDLWRQFGEEYREPLSLGEEEAQESANIREQAKRLYDALEIQGNFEGRVQDAFNIAKRYMQGIYDRLRAFGPADSDLENAQQYKSKLQSWLDI